MKSKAAILGDSMAEPALLLPGIYVVQYSQSVLTAILIS